MLIESRGWTKALKVAMYGTRNEWETMDAELEDHWVSERQCVAIVRRVAKCKLVIAFCCCLFLCIALHCPPSKGLNCHPLPSILFRCTTLLSTATRSCHYPNRESSAYDEFSVQLFYNCFRLQRTTMKADELSSAQLGII